jgi:hypothetical protein
MTPSPSSTTLERLTFHENVKVIQHTLLLSANTFVLSGALNIDFPTTVLIIQFNLFMCKT